MEHFPISYSREFFPCEYHRSLSHRTQGGSSCSQNTFYIISPIHWYKPESIKIEETALINLVYELIEKKLHDYRTVMKTLEKKHQQNFEQFTQSIRQNATYDDEEDWMEWKAAVEMATAWNEAKQQLLNDDIIQGGVV